MKRGVFILIMVLLIPMLTGCGNGVYAEEVSYADDYDEYVYEYKHDYEYDVHDDGDYGDYDAEIEIEAQILELAEFASYYFGRLQAIWDADDGAMWGVRLDLPVIIFCNEYQIAAATHPDVEGNFTRYYFGDIAVYAGVQRIFASSPARRNWNGVMGVFAERQAMQAFHFFGIKLNDSSGDAALSTIIHYAMHAIQPDLIGVSGAYMQGRADDESFVLEFNALLQALNASGEERFNAAHRALSYRNARRLALPNADADASIPGSIAGENLMAMSEGTTVYTELMMIASRDDVIAFVQRWPQLFDTQDHNGVLFGYIGGALYGILLDELGVDWRPLAGPHLDLGVLLQDALGITYFLDVVLP